LIQIIKFMQLISVYIFRKFGLFLKEFQFLKHNE